MVVPDRKPHFRPQNRRFALCHASATPMPVPPAEPRWPTSAIIIPAHRPQMPSQSWHSSCSARVTIRDAPMASPASTILLVEDDHSLRTSLSQFLADNGYRTLQADSARQGWELAKTKHPQL